MLALVGAVVIIDMICEETLTRVLKRNRGEALVALAWFFVHLMKEETYVRDDTSSAPTVERES